MSMAGRRQPAFDILSQADLLPKLAEARKALIRAGESMPRGSVTRSATDQIVRNIDDLTLLMTGDREYFWSKPHSIRPSEPTE